MCISASIKKNALKLCQLHTTINFVISLQQQTLHMSIFGTRPDPKEVPSNPQPAPAQQAAQAPAAAANPSTRLTVISEGTLLEGQLRVDGDLRIEGLIKGTVSSKGKVTMLKSGRVDGDIICQHAEISGHVTGKLKITEVLMLKANALIEGDIHTGKLVIENGVKFNGNCVMGNPATASAAPTPTPPKPASGNTLDLNVK
jgi:cytoskeletal protein CcmA (bactofilin family)